MEGQRRNVALVFIVLTLVDSSESPVKRAANRFLWPALVQGSYGRDKGCDCGKAYVSAAVGGVGLLGAVTGGILFLGFGPAGIAAGSWAATMMSGAATYGFGAGAVAAGQAAGAAGLAVGTKAAILAAGAGAGYAASGGCDCKC